MLKHQVYLPFNSQTSLVQQSSAVAHWIHLQSSIWKPMLGNDLSRACKILTMFWNAHSSCGSWSLPPLHESFHRLCVAFVFCNACPIFWPTQLYTTLVGLPAITMVLISRSAKSQCCTCACLTMIMSCTIAALHVPPCELVQFALFKSLSFPQLLGRHTM